MVIIFEIRRFLHIPVTGIRTGGDSKASRHEKGGPVPHSTP